MLMHFEARYLADTRSEAEAEGLALWRKFVQDPEAPLHWSASFIVTSRENADSYDVVMTVKDNKDQKKS